MKKIVISQPMFFPWIGLFEQIRLADIYVHYDDVQFSKGGFSNRVQIKTENGFKWLTVPLLKPKLGMKINEAKINNMTNWRRSHMSFLLQTYKSAPFQSDMLEIVNSVYNKQSTTVADISINSIQEVCKYYGLTNTVFHCSSELDVKGQSSQRVLDIVKLLEGKVYITGHGAKNYMNHELFEENKIKIEYMDYKRTPYPQLYEGFDPHVSILDLIANAGRKGIQWIHSTTKYWRDFINESNR